IFQTVFKTFLKNKEKIVNALQLPYSNAKLEATNNLIKLIICPFSSLAFFQPTTVDKEPFLFILGLFMHFRIEEQLLRLQLFHG
ncbi:TPA: transposase, partial [Streptococcus pneumoniae]